MTATSEPGHVDDWADTGPIPLAPATGDADKAREARYAEALRFHQFDLGEARVGSARCICGEEIGSVGGVDVNLARHQTRAVLPIVDAEVEAATRELRAEVERVTALVDLYRAEWVGTHQRPDCTCGGISACLACQSADQSEVEKLNVYAQEVDARRQELWRRAERAEAERDQLRAAMTALHSEAHPGAGWCAGCHDGGREDRWPCATLDAVARVGAADTQPEGAGEANHDEGCVEWCNHCEVCGQGTPYGSRCPRHPLTPTPHTAPESGEGR